MPVEAGHEVMDRLRRQTRDFPKRIEGNPFHKAILEGKATRETYIELLSRMYAFHLGFESQAERRRQWDEFGLNFQQRSRLGALRRDLENLQVNSEKISALELPLEQASFAFVCGYSYVIESSTMAGQNLLRLVARKFNLSAEHGGEYYSSYGTRAAFLWREFQEFLERVGQSRSGASAEIASGAVDGFQKLDVWLRMTPPSSELIAREVAI